MSKKLYMKVTRDKFELPLCVCSSVTELAARLGVKPHSIWKSLRRARVKGCKYPSYRVVEIEEDEDNDKD